MRKTEHLELFLRHTPIGRALVPALVRFVGDCHHLRLRCPDPAGGGGGHPFGPSILRTPVDYLN